jgi:hypothetical protein
MRLEGSMRTAAELRKELLEKVTAELHALDAAGAQEVSIESAVPSADEAYRVIVKSDVLPAPKTVAVSR